MSDDIANDDEKIPDGPEMKAALLAHLGDLLEMNAANQATLRKLEERLNGALAGDVHESVVLAAENARRRIAHRLGREEGMARNLAACASTLDEVSTVLDAIKLFRERQNETRGRPYDITEVMEWQKAAIEDEDHLITDIEAIEFASKADRTEEIKAVVSAMGDIMKGVTRLQALGFSIGEIQGQVDDFIGQKKKRNAREFSLLGPTFSPDDAKGTKRNKRVEAQKRKELLAKDEWLKKFLEGFWATYWQNAFEQSLPDEREKNVEFVRPIIPEALADAKEPQDIEEVLFLTRYRLGKIDRPTRVRLNDEHIITALDRLVAISHVVKIAGDTPRYWTRHLAEAAGIEVAPPRLTLVTGDGTEEE